MGHDLIQVLKALSDETRLRILNLLQNGDLCVCELEKLLGINQSNASRHLLKLTNCGLIQHYKSAKYVYYTIDVHVKTEHPFIELILESETKTLHECVQDLQRLESYKGQGYTCEDLKAGTVCFDLQQEQQGGK